MRHKAKTRGRVPKRRAIEELRVWMVQMSHILGKKRVLYTDIKDEMEFIDFDLGVGYCKQHKDIKAGTEIIFIDQLYGDKMLRFMVYELTPSKLNNELYKFTLIYLGASYGEHTKL